MSTKIKKKKSSKFLIRKIYLFGFLVIILVFTIISLYKLSNNRKSDFKVVDRISNIEKYKKSNNYTTIGWIKVQGTNIDYPVLFYDNAPIDDVTQNISWAYRNVKKLDDRTVIEGHNILNLSSNPLIADKDSKRFEQLLSFYDYNFAEKNKYIQYTSNGHNYVFEIFAVGFPEIEAYYSKSDYSSDEMKDYINKAIDQSLYKYDIDVNENDKIISLYTCTKFYGYDKAVVFRIDGRLQRKKEKLKNYSLEKTINYNEAKKYSNSRLESQEVKS